MSVFSIFSNMKFRIGTKLAITSGLGVVLVAGMVINQQMSSGWIDAASGAVENQQTIAKSSVEAKASARGMQVGVRDIRLAQTPEQMKAAVDYLNARNKSFQDQIDAAISHTVRRENRERFEKIKALGAEYFAGANDVVKAAQTGFDLRTQRNEASTAWAKTYDATLKSLAAQPDGRDAVAALREADRLFLASRNASWRFLVTGEAAMKEAVANNSSQAAAKLAEARSHVTDGTAKSAFDAL